MKRYVVEFARTLTPTYFEESGKNLFPSLRAALDFVHERAGAKYGQSNFTVEYYEGSMRLWGEFTAIGLEGQEIECQMVWIMFPDARQD